MKHNNAHLKKSFYFLCLLILGCIISDAALEISGIFSFANSGVMVWGLVIATLAFKFSTPYFGHYMNTRGWRTLPVIGFLTTYMIYSVVMSTVPQIVDSAGKDKIVKTADSMIMSAEQQCALLTQQAQILTDMKKITVSSEAKKVNAEMRAYCSEYRALLASSGGQVSMASGLDTISKKLGISSEWIINVLALIRSIALTGLAFMLAHKASSTYKLIDWRTKSGPIRTTGPDRKQLKLNNDGGSSRTSPDQSSKGPASGPGTGPRKKVRTLTDQDIRSAIDAYKVRTGLKTIGENKIILACKEKYKTSIGKTRAKDFVPYAKGKQKMRVVR